MNRNFYKRLSQIILEAETEEEATSDMKTGTDNTDSNEEELDGQTNNYQMDDSDFDTDTDEGQEEDNMDSDGEDNPEGTDDGMNDEVDNMEDENIEQNNNDISKKYMLASQYKELLLIVANLEKSMNNTRESETDPEQIHYLYIVLDKITNLKSKINFFVINNFITKPYEELLASFLFLKKELELIISLVEKLLDEKEE